MSEYPSFLKLESLLLSNETVLQWMATKYPAETAKWLALRRRMGANCPTARGVLKLICFYESKNENFIKSVETNEWSI